MFNKLYFICPTDNIESIINSKLNDNNFYIANSISFNYDFIKELLSIIESKKISDEIIALKIKKKMIQDKKMHLLSKKNRLISQIRIERIAKDSLGMKKQPITNKTAFLQSH